MAAEPNSDAAELIGHPLQLGGIRTGSIDYPQPSGGRPCRAAFVDTGTGLRFTVALDRGGDITDAVYNACPLAFATPNDLMPPSPAHQTALQWLRGWAGGLVTTCGPMHIGGPCDDEPYGDGLHGRFSNLPAAVTAIENPDPRIDRLDMSITTRIVDARMFGPVIEVERTIRCRLGESHIDIHDVVTNRGNAPAPHHWLYHCNVGYPLLAPGAKLVLAGRIVRHWGNLPHVSKTDDVKAIPGWLPEHAGLGEGGIILEPHATDGQAAAGIIHADRSLGLRIDFPVSMLPRLAVWQHFGRNSYVCGLEPHAGSLMHPPAEGEDTSSWQLAPGESREYNVRLTVVTRGAGIDDLLARDQPLIESA